MAQVLLLDGDVTVRAVVPAVLSRVGHRVRLSTSIEEARLAIRAGEIDALVLDVDLPDGRGFELLRSLHNERIAPRVVVVLSAMHQAIVHARARELGVNFFLTKPFNPRALVDALRPRTPSGTMRAA